jgi:hypothetical protein
VDERFRGKGVWIGLGALGIIFLCLMLCGMGAMFAGPRGAVYVQPPAGGEGPVAPPVYHGYGPFGFILAGVGFLFKLAFFGLLLLLGLGLVKRILWGHRCWGPAPGWKSPESPQGEGNAYAAWGPWAWHRHHRRKHWGPPPWWGPPPEAEEEADEPGEEYGVEE